MTTLRRILIATSLAVAATGVASANSIGCADTSAFTVVGGTSSVCFQASASEQTVNWGPEALSISQFNPALGTLNYVEIIGFATGNATLNVSNHSTTQSESFTNGEATIDESFSGTGFNTITLAGGLSGASGTVTPSGEVSTASTPFMADSTGDPTTISDTILNPNALAPFIGTGTLGSVAGSGGPSSAGGLGGTDLFYNATGQVGGTLAILYDYTSASATPEPTSMVMMGGALIGLGLIGKKRLKKG